MTKSESRYKTSNLGSGIKKPNYFWLRTTTEDTEQNKPTRNNRGNQLKQGRKRRHPNKTNPKLQTAMDAAVRTSTAGGKAHLEPTTTRTSRLLLPGTW